MAKRFSSTEIWDEDWFLEMPSDYKLYWFYMLSACNHAGFFRVNLKRFNSTNNAKILVKKALILFNFGKTRVKQIKPDLWYIEDFIAFQYGHQLNLNNNAHLGVSEVLKKHNIKPLDVRGVTEVKERVEKPKRQSNDN